MVKRMWPVLGLVSALLLAAASLHAEEDSPMAVSGARQGRSWVQSAPNPTLPPVASPALPGDDDMPNRTGSRPPTDNRISKAGPLGAPDSGGRLFDVLAMLRQRWLAYLVLYR
jgi:hypothetical protein